MNRNEKLESILDRITLDLQGSLTIHDIVRAAHDIIKTLPSPWSNDQEPDQESADVQISNRLQEWIIYTEDQQYIDEHDLGGFITAAPIIDPEVD